MSSPDQEGRLGLLHHYDSLMNGYKVYTLTFVVAIFTVVSLWKELHEFPIPALPSSFPFVAGIMSFSIGVFLSGIYFCVARFFWFGKLVEFAIYMPSLDSSVPICLSQLETRIFECTEEAARGKGDERRRMGPIMGPLARRAKEPRGDSLHCLPVALFAGWLAFLATTPWSNWTWIYLLVAVAGLLFSFGDP